jgi:hypothetical protein
MPGSFAPYFNSILMFFNSYVQKDLWILTTKVWTINI